ncbi:MAG: rod shape-determining protein RodA, partial [Deltaproteobacteria bacterium]|nr:rod shape-determining protein RodA [Deltaproteobacteria bacterium]
MRRRFLSDFHFSLLAVVTFLCIVGIFNLYSATYQTGGRQYLTQMYWMFGGFIFMTILVFLDYRVFERFSYPFYF